MPHYIKTHIPLAPYTTLGVGGSAEFFAEVHTNAELESVVGWAKQAQHTITLLGAGSNVLVRNSGVRGLVLRPIFMDIVHETKGTEVLVTAGAGVLLDTLIAELVSKQFWGLENLSAIPGTVGAVPVQNVGAYGVEAKDLIHTVTVFDTEMMRTRTLSNAECQFGYRDSIFKQKEGASLIILAVTFTVSTYPSPRLTYKDIQSFFRASSAPSLEEIRSAIVQIRSGKFPDWKTVGTAGSFFKNPIIERSLFERLQNEFPQIPGYPCGDTKIKVSLGWILDVVCHLRGYSEGGISLFERQALVLVCEKGTSADAVEKFSQKIIELVFAETGIDIEREVTILS